jgi:hypothetical protein
MPKKKPESVIHIIETTEGEFRPLYVAADKVGKVIIGPSKKTWSNWRSAKTGPQFYMVGGKPYYKILELEEYFGGNPVLTTGSE